MNSIGGFFLLLAAAIAVALVVIAVTGNIEWLVHRGREREDDGEPFDRVP
jgi:hypothetical protein